MRTKASLRVTVLPAVVLRNLHLILVIAWILLIIPTLLWWRDSVLWVAVMSLWANIAAHFSAWQSARVEVNQVAETE